MSNSEKFYNDLLTEQISLMDDLKKNIQVDEKLLSLNNNLIKLISKYNQYKLKKMTENPKVNNKVSF